MLAGRAILWGGQERAYRSGRPPMGIAEKAARPCQLRKPLQRRLVLAFALEHLFGVRRIHDVPKIGHALMISFGNLIVRSREKADGGVARAIGE